MLYYKIMTGIFIPEKQDKQQGTLFELILNKRKSPGKLSGHLTILPLNAYRIRFSARKKIGTDKRKKI